MENRIIMHLSITYPEVSSIVKQKAGRDIVLAYKDQNTLTASYKASVEIPLIKKTVSKDVSVDLQVLEFKDNKLVVRLDAGPAGNFALSAAQHFSVTHIPLTVYPGATDSRTFLLDLRDIEQLKPVLDQMTINSVGLFPEEIRIDAAIKP